VKDKININKQKQSIWHLHQTTILSVGAKEVIELILLGCVM